VCECFAVGNAFSESTAVHRIAPDRYRGAIPAGWDIAGNANGGVLLAIAARALLDATGRADPVTVTCHYLAPGRPGDVTIDVTVIKSGKSFATANAAMVDAEGRPIVQVLGACGDLAGAAGPDVVTGSAPDLPDPEDCVVRKPSDAFEIPFNSRIEMRLHPDDAGFAEGAKSGRALVRGWFRLPDDEPIDTVALLLAVDSFPPTIFNLDLPVAWTPTVELTVHVRARPVAGWLRCVFGTRFLTGGFLEEDGEVWDASGRLVAQSRQLALVPRAS
jgi:acyl-CoA thioesterase